MLNPSTSETQRSARPLHSRATGRSHRYAISVTRIRLPRIGTLGTPARLPRRGKAIVNVSVVDENGFAYEYREFEVDMTLARETIAQLHTHDELSAQELQREEASPLRSRESRRSA